VAREMAMVKGNGEKIFSCVSRDKDASGERAHGGTSG
jgi:hypothetical protein